MATIVSGTFLTFDTANHASDRLRSLQPDAGSIAEFYHSPDGHHLPPDEITAAHGEHEADGAGDGAAAGAGIGAALGTATGMLAATAAGPGGLALGAALGAFTGSLPGALGGVEASDQRQPTPVRRRGGPVVAVVAEGRQAQETAGDIFAAAGAVQVEIAEGRIINGEWEDYDPESVPHLVLDRTGPDR